MGNLSASEKGGMRAAIIITVMAALLAGIASDDFVTGFLVTAVVCGIALMAAMVLARIVNARRRR
ncbi:hypothetical protein DK926_15620 [Rhodococcus sp. Eu-32]|uniref:hypothetical protein n=1 Tax=Rhodococcus sp. Eu-32 TaxID=1017319 RepID=UPI000DF20C78|nr:hypothetical protein [Rhodococcus sp. Eu-32]RRQ26857.1 hypothetical protein DK926_15620 [Rhodococcus sp. Eu-32]